MGMLNKAQRILMKDRLEQLGSSIRDVYCVRHPEDELGKEIPKDVTYLDVLARPGKIYEMISPADDSIIREDIFLVISGLLEVDYSYIYDRWMNEFGK